MWSYCRITACSCLYPTEPHPEAAAGGGGVGGCGVADQLGGVVGAAGVLAFDDPDPEGEEVVGIPFAEILERRGGARRADGQMLLLGRSRWFLLEPRVGGFHDRPKFAPGQGFQPAGESVPRFRS